MGVLESFGDELLATRGGPAGWPEEVGAIIERFIDDIPHRNPAAIPTRFGVDVGLHPLQEKLTADRSIAVLEEPFRRAVVLRPDQAMADDFQIMLYRKIDEGVRQREI